MAVAAFVPIEVELALVGLNVLTNTRKPAGALHLAAIQRGRGIQH